MQCWDIFCAVVDNYGDIGTCWRLARQLAGEHELRVRLWVDDLQTFARLCPSIDTSAAEQQVGSVEIRHWTKPFPNSEAADVVIEAFACELPEAYLHAMAGRAAAPVWINLEYLSAETWVEDCHLLPSPHPKFPLIKHFFFPGFTAGTGGLIRERQLLAERAAFDGASVAEFWSSLDLPAIATGLNAEGREADMPFDAIDRELRVSLFCYDNTALPELLRSLSVGPVPVRVLALPCPAVARIGSWFGAELSPGTPLQRGALTVQAVPFLPQPTYDRLLWACDVNFVRGEDSFVRAQWAQQPFVWQIYPQDESAHRVKLDAFLTRYLNGFAVPDAVRDCWHAWNGTGDMAATWGQFLANRQRIQAHGKVWACQLDQTDDLANNLVRFALEKSVLENSEREK